MAGVEPEELEVATRFMNAMISATVRAGQEAAQDPPPPLARNRCRLRRRFPGPEG
jgi:hypothetical protein